MRGMKANILSGCDGCRDCVDCCTQGAILDGPSGLYVDFSRCNGCEECANNCPNGCIEIFDEKEFEEARIDY